MRMVAAISLAFLAAMTAAVPVAGTHSGSYLGGVAIGGVLAVSAAWLGIRLACLGVKLDAGRMTVRNLLRTRTVHIDEIREITLQKKDKGKDGVLWLPRIELTNGKCIWIDSLNCGPCARPPKPERVAVLNELQALVGLQPPGPGETDLLLTGTYQPASPASREAPAEITHANLAEWAEWIWSTRFSATRLRPGYDQEQVDAFLEAIRDTFLGVRTPALTSDEIRTKQFSITRLRPGYDEEEVDAFLNEAELKLEALQPPTMGDLE
jgi:DivIVA domain-containing protein